MVQGYPQGIEAYLFSCIMYQRFKDYILGRSTNLTIRNYR